MHTCSLQSKSRRGVYDNADQEPQPAATLEMSSPAWSEDVGGSSAMTWLQAAEHVLREEGPDMHIRELTSRIMELGMVKSNCATSLETLLYRQTSNSSSVSKFVRVSGKHGCFGLREDYLDSNPLPVPRRIATEKIAAAATESSVKVESSEVYDDEPVENELEGETKTTEALPNVSTMLESLYGFDREFEPRVFYTNRQRKRSYPTSGESSSGDERVNGKSPSKKRDVSSDEESITDETMYRKKYYFIKKIAKSIIFENAALADQLSLVNERITRTEAERKFLLDKLINFERAARMNPKPSACPPPVDQSLKPPVSTKALKSREKRTNPRTIPRSNSSKATAPVKTQRKAGKADTTAVPDMPKEIKNVRQPPPPVNVSTRKLVMSESSSSDESGSEEDVKGKKKTAVTKPAQEPTEGVGDKLELAMRCGKVRRLHPIPLNNDGSPMFPIIIGGLKVHNLGKIAYDRAAYHSERYLLPIGFESSRTYPSMIDPTRKCVYTCRILDGGETPMFEMVADDDPDHPVRAASSTACQTIVLRNINKARDKQATNSGSGPEFFGYSNPTILNLLQKIPDSRKCSKYKFMRFAEPQRRHKKGTPGSPSATKQPSTLSKKRPTNRPPKDVSDNQKKKHVLKPDTGGAVKRPEDSGLAIAPFVFGGMDTVSFSSSDDGSLSSEADLIIDS